MKLLEEMEGRLSVQAITTKKCLINLKKDIILF